MLVKPNTWVTVPSGRHEESIRAQMEHRWYELCREAGMSTLWSTSLFHMMEHFYKLPEGLRHYHTLEGHIYKLLLALDEFRKGNPFKPSCGWFAFIYALFMHDIFYVPGDKQNESKSGTLAATLLFGTHVERVSKDVAGLIEDSMRALPPHNYTQHADGPLLCDLDLVGFGSSYEDFMDDTTLIRKEFSFTTDEQFNQGRKNFFEEIYARGYIYHTSYFRELYEDQAKENIALYISDGRLVPVRGD